MEDLIKNFGIDWRLLLAQVVNFAILFFLLKKFAYKPVLTMLRRRKEEIEKGFAMRDEAAKTLGEIETLKTQTAAEAQEEALSLIKHAEETALERKEEIVHEALERGELLIAEAKKNAHARAETIEAEISEEAHHLVREGIARVLRQMPNDMRDKELISSALAAIRAEKAHEV